MRTRDKQTLTVVVVVLVLFAAVYLLLLSNGIVQLNNPSRITYPVRGVDVSSYQGDIDWEVLSAQRIHFAYIKATEGSSHRDSNFNYNYRAAAETPLRVGAYHFFSYDSGGETQADNFISIVYPIDRMLPPAVDVEFYGDKSTNLPNREATQRELGILLNRLEEFYGIRPVIYATERSYELFIEGGFPDHDIWIRNVFRFPSFPDERNWTFWQYTARAKLEGYNGEEKYIDLNVFNGTAEEFRNYE